MAFDEVDQLIIDKWQEVSDVVAAYESVRDKLKVQLELVEERLRRWGTEQGFEVQGDAKEGEFWAYRSTWTASPGGEPLAMLVVGGFVIDEAFGADTARPYAAIYCYGRGRRLSRSAFAKALRDKLSDELDGWKEDTDNGCPVNRYTSAVSAKHLMLNVEEFADFVQRQFIDLAEFADAVSDAVTAARADGGANG
jgi:hypothetical protein